MSSNGDIIKDEKSGIIFEKLLIVLEELTEDFNKSKETAERFKQYITGKTADSRKLYKDTEKVINRTSFIISTNNINKIFFDSKYDRRLVVFQISKEMKENEKYFNELYECMEDINVKRYFYHHVINNNEYNFNTNIQLKTKEKTETLNKKFQNVYEKFLIQMMIELNDNTNINEITLKDLFNYFVLFLRHENINKNIKYKEFVNEIKSLDVCIEIIDKHRHKKICVSRKTIYDFVIVKNQYMTIDEIDSEYEDYYLL